MLEWFKPAPAYVAPPAIEPSMEQAADKVLASLDADLAAIIAPLPWQRRVAEPELLAAQQIRLLRQIAELLQQLNGRNECSEARSNG